MTVFLYIRVKGLLNDDGRRTDMTDERIIELYFERSEEAIAETERAYGRYFLYVARGILQNEEDCREIVNDTYAKVWTLIPPERPKNLKAFIGNVTRQLSINRLESYKAQKRGCGQYATALHELEECIPDGGSDDICDAVALRDSLNRFVSSLTDDQRRVFIKRYWHMHSVNDIARELRMSESKVKTSLMRTRNKLKQHLTKEGFNV